MNEIKWKLRTERWEGGPCGGGDQVLNFVLGRRFSYGGFRLWSTFRYPRDCRNHSDTHHPTTKTLFREKQRESEEAQCKLQAVAAPSGGTRRTLVIVNVTVFSNGYAAGGSWALKQHSPTRFQGVIKIGPTKSPKVGKPNFSHQKISFLFFHCPLLLNPLNIFCWLWSSSCSAHSLCHSPAASLYCESLSVALLTRFASTYPYLCSLCFILFFIFFFF